MGFQMNKELELIKFTNLYNDEPFEYGELDCILLALRWLEIISGQKIVDEIKQHYSSMLDILNIVDEHGDVTLKILEKYGCKKLKKGQQNIGDFIAVHADPCSRINVCLGSTILAPTEDHGVIKWPLLMLEDFEVYRWFL